MLFVPVVPFFQPFGHKTGAFRVRSIGKKGIREQNRPFSLPIGVIYAFREQKRPNLLDVGANPAAGLSVGNPKIAERDEVPRRWLEGIPVRLARPNCRTERSVMPRRHTEQRRTRFAIIVLALASRSHRIDRLTCSG